jgi:PAS domain S-box-containing protein
LRLRGGSTEPDDTTVAQAALLAALELTGETVVITDTHDRILFVNRAFERMSGYSSADAVGRVAHELLRSVAVEDVPRGLIAAKRAGLPWTGEVRTRRQTGEVITEEVRLEPVRDAAGNLTNLVTIALDVTVVRALEADAVAATVERREFANLLRGLSPGESWRQTAEALCQSLTTVEGVDFAALVSFERSDRAIVLAGERSPAPTGTRLSGEWSAHLHRRAVDGPWAEVWEERPDDEVAAAITRFGTTALAYGPVEYDGRAVGLIVVGTTSGFGATNLSRQLSAVVEATTVATALLGPALADRDRIEKIVSARAFAPVFQPITELERGHVVGFEALTRFDDGTSPEEVFATAQRVGLGAALEEATLRASIAAAGVLPHGPWVSLNVSPDFVVSPTLAALLRRRTRPVVLEITEHQAITDYAAIHEAVAQLGPDVRLAVDDAGTGAANFGHIVELRPQYVKLDRILVRHLHTDLTRRALVAGLEYFARSLGIFIIAEGVEEPEELAALRHLGLVLGQGYLLGRPQPADQVSSIRSDIADAADPA